MGNSTAEPLAPNLKLTADRALFEGRASGLVMAFYENERPLRGLAGLMDWYFLGAFSKCIQSGAIRGQENECAYLPLKKNDRFFHFILIGAGPLSPDGKRGELPKSALPIIQKNLSTLKVPEIAISRSDLGSAAENFLLKNVKGISLWIAP